MENGLFYTGMSLVRIGEKDVAELPTAAEILADLEDRLAKAPRPSRSAPSIRSDVHVAA
jgi:hypothetical protein